MGKELNLDKYITAGNEKIIPPNMLVDLSVGALVGVTKNKNQGDMHFVYKNWNTTIDAMDHTRPAATNYFEYSYRPLYWAKY